METDQRSRGPRVGSLVLALLLGACRMPGTTPRSTLVLGQPTSALTLDPHLHDEESTYSTLSTVIFRPLNCTVSPARAPSMAWKIGAIVEMPISSCP